MKKLTAGSLAALAMVAIVFSTARANDHSTPGSPGTPSCRGQTTAFLAQAAKNGFLDDALHAMGIGGVARSSDISVQAIHDIVEGFCGPVITP